MRFKIPRSTEKCEWTKHAVVKMKQYGLTAQRVLRVVNNPQRVEEGVAANTIAVMQPASTRIKNGKRAWSSEIWAMYQIKRKTQSAKLKTFGQQRIRLISAWRYPGISPKRDPIPNGILRELKSML